MVEVLKLSLKSEVWACLFTCAPYHIHGVIPGHLCDRHQIGYYQRGAPGDARQTMNKHVAIAETCLVDEVNGFLEESFYILLGIVAGIEPQVFQVLIK